MSGPSIGIEDQFEEEYTGKFRTLVAPFGVVVKYERDRAGLDIGLHVNHQHGATPKSRALSHTKVWFQLKGKHSTTLARRELATTTEVAVSVDISLLKFWYASPEPVYLTVYLEASDEFIAEDVREIADRRWPNVLSSTAFPPDQKTVTLHVRRNALLDRERLSVFTRHQALRIDGPQWRGRPLGHQIDPLRSEIQQPAPQDYLDIVRQLLDAHQFEWTERLDAHRLLGLTDAHLHIGRMFHTYEWTHPLFTEFGFDEGETFRIESAPMHVQGRCIVLILPEYRQPPKATPEWQTLLERETEKGVEWVLVFANTSLEPAGFGGFRVANAPLNCVPQDLGSLTFNILTATSVYLAVREKIDWKLVHYICP